MRMNKQNKNNKKKDNNYNLMVKETYIISKNDKKLLLTAFHPNGEEFYKEYYSLDYTVIDADVRIDTTGNPVCVFYHKDKGNFIVSLWQKGKSTNILLNEEPI